MTQLTMYPGFVNSPYTILSAGITDVATSIPVYELGVFPAARNIAVMGSGSDAETVLYTVKSAETGAGTLTVIREWNKTGTTGAKKAWLAGTVISRRFTEYDHATFKTNIEDHETNKQAKVTTARRFLSVIQGVQPATNGATWDQYETATNKINRSYALFPAASTKYVMWEIGLDDWNAATIKIEPVYDSTSAETGSVVFNAYGLRLPDGATIDSAFGSAIGSTDTYQGTGKDHIGPQTADITPAGASGSRIILRVTRGTDTLAADVRLMGVWIEWPVTRV